MPTTKQGWVWNSSGILILFISTAPIRRVHLSCPRPSKMAWMSCGRTLKKKTTRPLRITVYSSAVEHCNTRLHVYSHPSGFGKEIWTKHKLICAGAEISDTGMNWKKLAPRHTLTLLYFKVKLNGELKKTCTLFTATVHMHGFQSSTTPLTCTLPIPLEPMYADDQWDTQNMPEFETYQYHVAHVDFPNPSSGSWREKCVHKSTTADAEVTETLKTQRL